MKPNTRTNGVLAACVVVLVALCALSVSAPLRFGHERERREQAVIQRLVQIRQAQARYLQAHGTYAASLDSLVDSGYLPAQARYIPYSGGRPFRLSVTVTPGTGGRSVPLMECGALYTDYLDGLDAQEIGRIAAKASDAGQYAGLKIGDLTTANDNAGNWE